MVERQIATFAERINALIDSSGISASRLAADLGVSKQAVSTWQAGRRSPKKPTIQTIARHFGVNEAWLEGYDVAMRPPAADRLDRHWSAPLTAAYQNAPPPTQRNICKLLDIPHVAPGDHHFRKRVKMMVYSDPAAAGMPLYAESEFQRLEFYEDEVPEGADFGVRISGKSMEPTIQDGEIAWVYKTPEIFDGQIGIFMLGDHAVCKRARINRTGRIQRLESDNPAYDDIQGRDLIDLRSVGRVLLH